MKHNGTIANCNYCFRFLQRIYVTAYVVNFRRTMNKIKEHSSQVTPLSFNNQTVIFQPPPVLQLDDLTCCQKHLQILEHFKRIK
jgi:hypothetical protein